MNQHFSEQQQAQVRHLIDGALKVFQNAEQLYHEGSLLCANGAFCRALFLHQISMEECGKIEMLAGWIASIFMGEEVDTRKVSRAMANHKAKNEANAYFLPVDEVEKKARDAADISAAVKAFDDVKSTFHRDSNLAKNASLYVDYDRDEFKAPTEMITASMAQEIANRNVDFLEMAHHKIEVMSNWRVAPDKIAPTLETIAERLKALRATSPADLESALVNLLDEFRRAGIQSGDAPKPTRRDATE